MSTALFMLSGIALIAVSVGLYDWLTRRKDRETQQS